MFCLHIYFNFLLKASWIHNLFYFLSIFKYLQVKIQACFSSQALPISFIQHSTTISSNKQLCIAGLLFFQEPILKIWLQIVVKAGAINFDALHQLLYL